MNKAGMRVFAFGDRNGSIARLLHGKRGPSTPQQPRVRNRGSDRVRRLMQATLTAAAVLAGGHHAWAQGPSSLKVRANADTVGIIANVSAVLAEAHANIIDISQTTVREFFAMIMMADLENATVPFDELKRRLDAKGAEMGLRIDAQHEDVFKFMHRV